jgi:SAM-dependent methyltransferase
MLPAAARGARWAMARSGRGPESNLQALGQLSEGLLQGAGHTGVRGNLLEIHHPQAPRFDPLLLHTAASHGVSISLSQDGQPVAGQRVCCRPQQLPFQDRSFSMVILHHVIGTGDEAELAEAVRVLARHGVLLLLGLNRMGWRYRAQDNIRRLPGIAPLRVKARLEALGMVMRGFAGAGLCGLRRPVFLGSGLAAMGAPLADLLLLQARHRDSPEMTPLRFGKARSSVVQSAPMRG